jgi:transcriptional regulator NrdR family protein
MRCPKCGSVRLETRDSRKRDGVILRVRRCGRCRHRFRTKETPDAQLAGEAASKTGPSPYDSSRGSG